MLPVFYINLDRRPDRRDFMEAQLQRLGLQAERVPAVIPGDIPPEVVARQREANLRDGLRPVRPGELACTLSHKRVWTAMADRGLHAALILEDDARLSPSLPALLADEGLGGDWYDILKLETTYKPVRLGRARHRSEAGISIHPLMSVSLRTAAYIVTGKTARAVLASEAIERMPVDEFLFSGKGPVLHDRRVYQAVPALACQVWTLTGDMHSGVGVSDLQDPHQRSHVTQPPRLSAQSWRNGLRLLRTYAASDLISGLKRQVVRLD